MTDLEAYKLVNKARTREELATAVELIGEAGIIKGRTRIFNPTVMALNVFVFLDGGGPAEILTRNYGIRQQAIYIKTYEKGGKDYSAIVCTHNEE